MLAVWLLLFGTPADVWFVSTTLWAQNLKTEFVWHNASTVADAASAKAPLVARITGQLQLCVVVVVGCPV